jgi:hypothetical protein
VRGQLNRYLFDSPVLMQALSALQLQEQQLAALTAQLTSDQAKLAATAAEAAALRESVDAVRVMWR